MVKVFETQIKTRSYRRRLRETTIILALTVALILSLEIAARVYGAIKYRNPKILPFGSDFVSAAWSGQLERAWVRGPVNRNGELAVRAQHLFENRSVEASRPIEFQEPADRPQGRYNNLGLRGPDVAALPTPGRTRIVALGGSFVFGGGVKDDEAWPHLVQQQLERRGVMTEMINAGDPGGNIHHLMIDVFRNSLLAIRPDALLLVTAYNNHPLIHSTIDWSLGWKINYYAYQMSYLYTIVREKAGVVMGNAGDYLQYRREVLVSEADLNRVLDIYRLRIRQFSELAREQNVQLILMTQPERFFDSRLDRLSLKDRASTLPFIGKIKSSGKVYGEELDYVLQTQFNLAMIEVARESALPLIDISDLFGDRKQALFQDQIHPIAAGNQMIADHVAGALEPLIRGRPRRAKRPN